MKLGITTNVFASQIKKNEITLEGVLNLASEIGMKSVEIRDDLCTLMLDEVRKLKEKADAKGLSLSYAIRTEMLATGDRALFEKGVLSASACGGRRVLRAMASQDALKVEGKKGYIREELDRLVKISNEYGEFAAKHQVLVAIEHAREPLFGDGRTYFGMSDLLERVEAGNVGLTFDPANATNVSLCKASSTVGDVLRFVDMHLKRVFLVHYKTTKGGKGEPTIGDADIDHHMLFERLKRGYDHVVCIEIPGTESLDLTRKNLRASLNYMKEKNLMGYFQKP